MLPYFEDYTLFLITNNDLLLLFRTFNFLLKPTSPSLVYYTSFLDLTTFYGMWQHFIHVSVWLWFLLRKLIWFICHLVWQNAQIMPSWRKLSMSITVWHGKCIQNNWIQSSKYQEKHGHYAANGRMVAICLKLLWIWLPWMECWAHAQSYHHFCKRVQIYECNWGNWLS